MARVEDQCRYLRSVRSCTLPTVRRCRYTVVRHWEAPASRSSEFSSEIPARRRYTLTTRTNRTTVRPPVDERSLTTTPTIRPVTGPDYTVPQKKNPTVRYKDATVFLLVTSGGVAIRVQTIKWTEVSDLQGLQDAREILLTQLSAVYRRHCWAWDNSSEIHYIILCT